MWRKHTFKKIILFSMITLITFGMVEPLFMTTVRAFGSGGGSTGGTSTHLSDKFTPVDGARSWLYLRMLSYCFSITPLIDGDKISAEHAEKINWFKDPGYQPVYNNGVAGPPKLDLIEDNSFLSEAGFTSGVSCYKFEDTPSTNKSSWIRNAVKLWGYDSAASALCDFGFVRANSPNDSGNDCVNGSGDFKSPNGTRLDSDKFRLSVLSKVYGGNFGNDPTLTKAQNYTFNWYSFRDRCLGLANSMTPSNAGPAERQYHVNVVDNSTGRVSRVAFVGMKPRTETIYNLTSIQSPQRGNLSAQCGAMEAVINANAAALSTWIKNNIKNGGGGNVVDPTSNEALNPSGGTNNNTTDNSCGAQVSGIGWIICPIISALTKLDDGMWSLVSGLLNVSPIKQSNQAKSIYSAWGSIRSIANILFVIFFLVIIFSQLTGAGITNYGVKKMLPKIIIAAILVNVSFIIIQLAVDLANIIGSSLYNFIVGMAPAYTVGWGSALDILVGVAGAGAAAVGVVALAGGPTALFFILLGLALISALGLLTAVLTLIFRQAAIIVLAILAPLAFVAYLLPNTESWFKKWRGLLLSMLMMYPMAALIFAGAQFAAATIIGNGKDFWNIMIGLTMMALPLFSLPFIARQGGSILSRVNGALQGVANRANQPIRDTAKSFSDSAAARFRANNADQRGGVLGGFQRVGRGLSYPSRHLSRAWEGARLNREAQTETAQSELKSQLGRNQVRGMFGRRIRGQETDVAAAAAKEMLAQNATMTSTRLKEQNPTINARHGETMGLNERGYAAEGNKKVAEARVKEGLMENRGFDELRRQIDHSESIAGAAENRAAGRVERDPTTLQVRRDAFEAEADLNTDKKWTETGIGIDSTLDDTRARLEEATVAAEGATSDAAALTELDPRVQTMKSYAEGAKMRHEAAQEVTKQTIADDPTLDADRDRLENAKTIADTATKLASDRTEAKPEILRARAANKAAERKLDTTKKNVQTTITSASSDTPSAEAIAGIDAATRLSLHTTAVEEERAKQESDEATDTLATDLENNLTLQDERLAAATAKKEHEAATSQNTQLVTEATSGVKAEPGSRLAGVDATIRTRLQTAQFAASNAASATSQAQREITYDYTEELLDDSTGAATAAAGIGGQEAEVRVKAGATAAQSKQMQEDVSANKTLFAERGLTTGDDPKESADKHQILDIIVNGVVPGVGGAPPTTATTEELITADEMMVDTTSRMGMAQTWDAIAAMPGGPTATEEQRTAKRRRAQAFRDSLKRSGNSPKFIGGAAMGDLAAGTPSDTYMTLAKKVMQKTKISAGDFLGLDKDEIGIYGAVLADDPSVLSNDQKEALRVSIEEAYEDKDIRGHLSQEKRDRMDALYGLLS